MIRLVILRLLESYFRHRWLYLLPCVVMAVVGGFYVSQMPASYISRGTIYVQDKTLLSSLTSSRSDGYTWVTPSQAMVNELKELFTSEAFLRAVIENTDLEIKLGQGRQATSETIGEARDAIWAESLGNNLVLIGSAHEMPRVALQLVESTTDTYIKWKTNLSHNDSVAAQSFFADLIKTYSAEVEPAREQMTAYLVAHPQPVRGDRPAGEEIEIARLTANLDRATERLNHAENQEETARLALVQTESDVRQAYSIVDAPERPLAPERSKKTLLLTFIMFLGAGMVVTVTGIVGGALLDNTFRFPIDIQHGLSLPTLALVADRAVEVSMKPISPIPTVASSDQVPDVDKVKVNGVAEMSKPLSNGTRKRHPILG